MTDGDDMFCGPEKTVCVIRVIINAKLQDTGQTLTIEHFNKLFQQVRTA